MSKSRSEAPVTTTTVKNGVKTTVVRTRDGSSVQADCQCFGDDNRCHSTNHCPNFKRQQLRDQRASADDSMRFRVKIGTYNIGVTFAATPEGREEYRKAEAEAMAALKEDALLYYGVKGHPGADRAWELARDYANGSGIEEILNYFNDLVELLQVTK